MIKKRIDIKCPYCGQEDRYPLEIDAYGGKQIITCDIDEGGCDTAFAVDLYPSIDVIIYKLEKHDGP